jgi:hypothetical protein
LFDFIVYNFAEVNVSENLGGSNVIDTNDIEELFNVNGAPDGNGYFVLGLDFDIVKHWGIGVRFLIWSAELSDNDYRFSFGEPSRFQTRVSTYFVF